MLIQASFVSCAFIAASKTYMQQGAKQVLNAVIRPTRISEISKHTSRLEATTMQNVLLPGGLSLPQQGRLAHTCVKAAPPCLLRAFSGASRSLSSAWRCERSSFFHHSVRPGCMDLAARKITCSAAAAADAPPQETYEYQAEVDRLMDMIVNSLYSNREIFLRELVSNCSDALDKARIAALTEGGQDGGKLEIRVKANPEARTVVIEDTGIGMTRQELLDSLGTIARSGTARFAEAVKESKGDANLIGRFGVGFYSSFLVADRVTVQTKNANDPKQWRYESALGSTKFTITDDSDGEPLQRGTRVTLHLKEDATEMAAAPKLQQLIQQYSQFIQFPINLWTTRSESEQVVDDEKTKKKQEEADKAAKEAGKDAETVAPEMKTEKKDVWDWTVQNDSKPLWTRSPKQVKKEEYDEFFKQTFQEFLEPLTYSHFNVEGTYEFSALLFVPGMAPFQQEDFSRKPNNIKLFVRRVFIGDEFGESLMPRYLSFIKGVVDSSDLPLNVSREILQESRVVRAIQRQLVKRTLDLLTTLSQDTSAPETPDQSGGAAKSSYSIFYESFGKYIKLGLIEDKANKDQLAELVRFRTSQSGEEESSLKEYVSRMKPGQQGIFFIAADSVHAAESSPFVEKLQKRGLEVLYLTDVIDEPALQNLEKYADKELIDVTREGLNLGEDEEDKQQAEEQQKALQPLTDFMKGILGEKVEKVTVSQRLADSPCALVTSKFGWSAYQERVMRSQMLSDNRSAEYMRGRRSLEINPDHPIIKSLSGNLQSNTEEAESMTYLLYDAALITSGFSVDAPKEFGQRLYGVMSLVLGSDVGSMPGSNGSSTTGDGSGTSFETVEPEVQQGSGSNDPWNK